MNSNYWNLYRQRQKDFVVNGGDINSYTGYEINELWEYIPDDEQGALEMLLKGMLKGNCQAANYCLIAAIKGHTFTIDGEGINILKLNEIAAATGEPESLYNLGMQYGLDGDAVSLEKAAKYYRMAAENGNANGMSRLAMFYAYGNGVKKCPEIAAYWVFVKPHGDNIDPSTQDEFDQTAAYLASELNYINNINGQVSCSSNEEVTIKAAEAGERDAWACLASWEENKNKQKEYFLKAAELGSPNGQMGYAFLNRHIDDATFAKYSLLASEQGCAPAQQDYSQYLLEKGDVVEAKKWLETIVNHGNSKRYHSFITWAYNELSYIFYKEGNKERALFCWHCTDGEYASRTSVNWDNLENELYPSDSANLQDETEDTDVGETHSGCMSLLAIPLVIGMMAYMFL